MRLLVESAAVQRDTVARWATLFDCKLEVSHPSLNLFVTVFEGMLDTDFSCSTGTDLHDATILTVLGTTLLTAFYLSHSVNKRSRNVVIVGNQVDCVTC